MATANTATKKATAEYMHETGGRKSSKARVFMKPGKGEITINNRKLEDYLGRETSRMIVRQPLAVTNLVNEYDINVTLKGGGANGQAGAIRLAIAKVLASISDEFKVLMRKAGFLTRDARSVERKKVGLKKARRAKQFSKR